MQLRCQLQPAYAEFTAALEAGRAASRGVTGLLRLGCLITVGGRRVQVGRGHRLAARPSVCVEDLGDEEVHDIPPTFPAAVYDAIVSPVTPSGRPIRCTWPWESDEDMLTAVARGHVVHPGFAGHAPTTRLDLVQIPIRDLPPMPFGLIWRTACHNARIRALAATAAALSPADDGHRQRVRPVTD